MNVATDITPGMRRRQFCEDHPDIRITSPKNNGTRCWLAYCDGMILAADYNLSLLLDDLDWLLGETAVLFGEN